MQPPAGFWYAPWPDPLAGLPPLPLDPLPLPPPLLPLRWGSDGTAEYYTDGACETQDEGPNLLGAAFYHAPTGATFLVSPISEGETNTITRAELAPIYAALKHSLPDTTLVPPHPGHPKIAILSDSLAAIYMVQRVVRRPGTLSVHKHQPLLHHIYLLILARAALGLRTSFHKVRAHTGVTGNEKADAGAGAALGDPASCEYWMPNNSHSLFPRLAAWLQTPDPNPKPDAPPRMLFLDNLTAAVVSLAEAVMPSHPFAPAPVCPTTSRAAHPPPFAVPLVPTTPLVPAPAVAVAAATRAPAAPGYYWRLRQEINAESDGTCSNHMWHGSCTWKAIKNVLSIRFGTLMTAARAQQFRKPYITALGVITNGLCPLCRTARDTAGHILGACPHARLQPCYIARHNAAVRAIQQAISSGSLCDTFMIMDATSTRRLPSAVAGTRLPAWLLPAVPAAQVAKMRPDLLIIEHMRLLDPSTHDMTDPTVLAGFQSRCRVHVVEVGYCSESSSFRDARLRKDAQHVALCDALRAAGWKLANPLDQPNGYPVFLLGMAGTIFNPCAALLSKLGVSATAIRLLMQRLHVSAVRTAHQIVCLRRRLERPKHRTSPAAPLTDPALHHPP